MLRYIIEFFILKYLSFIQLFRPLKTIENYLYILRLSCLFVWIQRQNCWTDPTQIFRGADLIKKFVDFLNFIEIEFFYFDHS